MSCFGTLCRNNASLLYFSLSSKSVVIFANYCFTPVFEGFWCVSLHAYKSIILAVKTGQPHNWICSVSKETSKIQNCFYQIQKKPSVKESFLRSGRDSNSRPHAWQACILTDWTTGPSFSLELFLFVCECKDTTFFRSHQIFLQKIFHFYSNQLIIRIKKMHYFLAKPTWKGQKTFETNLKIAFFEVFLFVFAQNLSLSLK